MKLKIEHFPVLLFIVVLLLTLSGKSEASCSKVDNLSFTQKLSLSMAYRKGEEHNLGYTVMAIALKESTAGKYLINVKTQDYGLLGINLKTAASREGVTGFRMNILAQRLVLDEEYNVDMGLKELLYWQGVRASWRDVISSYNAGWNMSRGRDYMKVVADNVRMLKLCGGELV